MGCSPQRSAGNSFDSASACSAPASGSGKQQPAGRPPLGHGHHSSAAAASTQTQAGNGGGPHPDLGGISGGFYGERPHQSTATSMPAAVAGSLASLAQRFSGQ